ncbi:MAG: sialate O-acetylesterase [Planctomycetaceae bacterium]
MPRLPLRMLLLWMVVIGLSATAGAAVRLPAIISDNMVLQAEKPLPIWGWAEPGEEVTVTLGSTKETTKANEKGKWQVTLPAQQSSGTAVEMSVAGKNAVTVRNILIGEVWGGSGQSNMQWSVQMATNAKEEVASANYPQIRLFIVPLKAWSSPLDDVQAKWVVCSPLTVGPSSAVLYFFGREIHKSLNVPVGLVTTAWGGSRIEPWISAEQLASQPELKSEHDTHKKEKAARSADLRAQFKVLRDWLETAEKVPADQDVPDPPAFPADKAATMVSPTAMYNSMIHPLRAFALRGFLWYQGESNRGDANRAHYTDLMKGLIEAWRKAWNQGEFPFLYVQLAPYNYDFGKNEFWLPEIWEAQTAALSIPNTGMAVTTDIATINDIHPPNKQDVGRRLALWALAKTYGKSDVVYSGPLFDSMAVEGNKVRLKFRHTGGGLVSRNGQPLTWFTIAGEDKQFHKADAVIDGETVMVSSPAVTSPVAVRFGWHQIAEPNLSNKAGLPAAPFRTDKWADAKNAEL